MREDIGITAFWVLASYVVCAAVLLMVTIWLAMCAPRLLAGLFLNVVTHAGFAEAARSEQSARVVASKNILA